MRMMKKFWGTVTVLALSVSAGRLAARRHPQCLLLQAQAESTTSVSPGGFIDIRRGNGCGDYLPLHSWDLTECGAVAGYGR